MDAKGFYFVFVRMYEFWMQANGRADVFTLGNKRSRVSKDRGRIRHCYGVDMLILCLFDDLLWVLVQIDVTMSIHETSNWFLWDRHHDFCLKNRSTSSIPRLKTPVRASTSAVSNGPALMISLVI